jgi:hypothetical protein
VAALDQLAECAVAAAAPARPGLALEQRHDHAVRDAEARHQRLGRLRHELLEALARPAHEAGRRRLPRLAFAAARFLRRRGLVRAHVLGRLAHHAAALVEALPPGAPGDLLEVAHREQAHALAVVLAEAAEEHAPDGDVHAHAERVGARHHAQQTLLRELLDQQPVLR